MKCFFSIKSIIIGLLLSCFLIYTIILCKIKHSKKCIIENTKEDSIDKNKSNMKYTNKKPLGIDRYDNACYIISTIQSLMNLFQFKKYVSNYSKFSKIVTSSLNKLMRSIFHCTDEYVNYSEILKFKENLSNKFKYLGTSHPGNASDFLVDIIDNINEENNNNEFNKLFTIEYKLYNEKSKLYGGKNSSEKHVGYNKIWNICTQNDLLNLLNDDTKILNKNSTIEFSLGRGKILSYPKYLILSFEMTYVLDKNNSYDIIFNKPENIILYENHNKDGSKSYNKYAINSIVFYVLNEANYHKCKKQNHTNIGIGHYFCLKKLGGIWYICDDKFVQEINYETFFGQKYENQNFINYNGGLCFPNIVILEKQE